jgi:hypothetical protein
MIVNCAIGLGALGLIGWRRKKKPRSVAACLSARHRAGSFALTMKSWLVLYL